MRADARGEEVLWNSGTHAHCSSSCWSLRSLQSELLIDPASLELDALLPDHLAPLRRLLLLVGDELLGRRCRPGLCPARAACPSRPLRRALSPLRGSRAPRSPRGAGRREHAERGDRFEAGQARFGDRRQLRHERRALRRAGRDRAQPAGLRLGQGGDDVHERERRFAGDQRLGRRTAALVRARGSS